MPGTATLATAAEGAPRGRASRSRRQRAGWRYTRFVALMRRLLPASALLLAATVIVWPSLNGEDTQGTGGTGDPGTQAAFEGGRPTMSNARFLGTDDSGHPYTVTAVAAWQEKGGAIVHLEGLEGALRLENGARATVSSERGVWDRAARTLAMESNVTVVTDDGYRLHSERATVDLATGTASGSLPVRGEGPAGLIEAQGFLIADGGELLAFAGRVHLTLLPGGAP